MSQSLYKLFFIFALNIILTFVAAVPQADAAHKSQYNFVSHSDGPWNLLYSISQTDGLLINHAKWNGIEQFKDMKLPQITVEYPPWPQAGPFHRLIIDELGWSGNNKPCTLTNINDLYDGGVKAGFQLWVDFRLVTDTCPQPPESQTGGYTYIQAYDFWYNGVVVPHVKIYGPGLWDEGRYHVYFRLDLSAHGNELNFFEYYAITTIQYPPHEHDFHDDEVYRPYTPVGYEWMNRIGPPDFKGYVSRPWINSALGPPSNQNAYWTFVHVPGEQEGGPPDYNTEWKPFINFPKAWDNNQPPIDAAQDLVNWFVSTVQSSASLNYCRPTNHCLVGIWYTPFNY